MKKQLSALVFLVASFAFADPIKDIVVGTYRAAWLPSTNTSCAKICAAADRSKAEYEVYHVAAAGSKDTYVCKSQVDVGGAEAGGQLYGNNLSGPNFERFCMVATHTGAVLRQKKFSCLCTY